ASHSSAKRSAKSFVIIGASTYTILDRCHIRKPRCAWDSCASLCRMRAALLLLFLSLAAACGRTTSAPRADAESARTVVVHVPGALRIARGLDTLSVEIDPASRADANVVVDPAMVLGVESWEKLHVPGGAQAGGERHGFTSGSDIDVGTSTWSTAQDGIPQREQKYVAEITFILFETDVAPGHHWDPHAGHFRALLTRTIRQVEE
ncbi:MAG: hypothetical protein ACRELY_11670, partial [Polyangiaceae bacterium]